MAYVDVSIPKVSASAGVALSKSCNVILIPVSYLDLETFPERQIGSVEITEDISLITGKSALSIYMTHTTIKRFDTSEGPADARGYKSSFEGEHPGDSPMINNFLEFHANEGFVIISSGSPSDGGTRVQGTPYNPMYMVVEEQDDKDGRKKTLKFAQEQVSAFKASHYSGAMPTCAAATDDTTNDNA